MCRISYLRLLLLPSALVIASCAETGPSITNLDIDPDVSETVPLAARVELETDRPTRVSFEVSDGTDTWTIDPRSPLATVHDVPLLGLRAAMSNSIVVRATDESGSTT
jgi:hypothetical protein